MEKLSVIMTVYNEKADWLKKSIESILNQSFDKFELIIILDDPSNEELANIVSKFKELDSRIKSYTNDVNMGLVKSLNRAIGKASGKFIARMDADDIAMPDRFEKQIEFLNSNEDIKLVGTNWKCIGEDDEILFNHGKLPSNYNFIKNNIKYNNMFLHPSWMFKAEILTEIEGYREMTFCEDFDFITRLLTSNIKISNINEYLMLYRVRESSISISKAYEQYINTNKSIKYMKQRYKYNSDEYGQCITNIFDEVDKEKYLKATQSFISSRESLKEKKYIEFIYKFSRSFLLSKHRARKNLNLIIYNIKLVFQKKS